MFQLLELGRTRPIGELFLDKPPPWTSSPPTLAYICTRRTRSLHPNSLILYLVLTQPQSFESLPLNPPSPSIPHRVPRFFPRALRTALPSQSPRPPSDRGTLNLVTPHELPFPYATPQPPNLSSVRRPDNSCGSRGAVWRVDMTSGKDSSRKTIFPPAARDELGTPHPFLCWE